MTILAVAGVVAVSASAEATRAVEHARSREAELRAADVLLGAVALWPREDLDRHLGSRAQGPWRMTVDRPWPTLYVVTLTDTATAREVLRTALYRPEAPRVVE